MALAVVQNVEKASPSAASSSILDGMSALVRSGGACVLWVNPDGSLGYRDAEAGAFFQRYVVPSLEQPEMAGEALRAAVSAIKSNTRVQTWSLLPGVLIGALPVVERRQVVGVLAVAAKSADFTLCEDVLRSCARLALDGEWLAQQAEKFVPFSQQRLEVATTLLSALLADRSRLGSLDDELNLLSSQLANAYEELSLIYQVNAGMRVNRRSTDFFRDTCLEVKEVIGVAGMGVGLFGDELRQPPVLYGQLSLPPGQVQRLAEQLIADMRGGKSGLLINDLSQHKTYGWLSPFAKQLIAAPLQRQDQILGCLFGIDKANGDFDSVDSKLLNSIANESAIYIENAMLFSDVHDLLMGLLHSLTSAVDAKDNYTCGHSERVALLSRHLAQQIKLPDAKVERVYMAGLLHDVGKIGVPESVLQKTGRLTAEEYEQMKRHPRVGARILADVKQLGDVVPGVLCHHERYDGRGYPAGLAGQDIPLMGRIICLADCFDAMTSNRTYRKALPLEVAMMEIRRCAGTQFDPALAEVMLKLTNEQFQSLYKDHQLQAKKLLELQQTVRAA